MIDELVRAIGHQNPNADDLRLLDRIMDQCERSEYISTLRVALGPAPMPQEIREADANGPLPQEWWRAFYWCGLLPAEVAAQWVGAVAEISATRGSRPGRNYYENPPIFGTDAAGDLGQRTIELSLKWGRPCQWLLENYRDEVWAPVTVGSQRALQHVILAMLNEWAGHLPAAIADKLREKPDLLSSSGEAIAIVMRHTTDENYLARTVEHWQAAIDVNVPDVLLQFGRLFMVEGWMLDCARKKRSQR